MLKFVCSWITGNRAVAVILAIVLSIPLLLIEHYSHAVFLGLIILSLMWNIWTLPQMFGSRKCPHCEKPLDARGFSYR
jgi:hypothetical protein